MPFDFAIYDAFKVLGQVRGRGNMSMFFAVHMNTEGCNFHSGTRKKKKSAKMLKNPENAVRMWTSGSFDIKFFCAC